MKKLFLLFVMLAGAVSLSAQAPYCCTTKGTVTTFTDYDAKGHETGTTVVVYKDVNVISDLDYDVVVETTVTAGGTENTFESTLEVRNGNALVTMAQGSIDFATTDPELLQIPNKLAIGYKLPLGDIYVNISGFRMKSTITENEIVDREEITTPAGTFKCYVLQQTSEGRVMGIKSSSTLKVWYARGIGQVKQETYSKGELISRTVLTSISK